MTLQPPGVPVFVAGTPGSQMAATLNRTIRDPFTFLLDPPTVRLRRVGALNLQANQHQYIPFDQADEDSEGGWTAPVVVGGGANTTLSSGSSTNTSSIVVVSATGMAAGDFIRIDAAANTEYRRISTVAGTTVNVSSPLRIAHSAGAAVVEVTSDPARYYPQAPGWYMGTVTVSLSGNGATGLTLTPAISVNMGSPTGTGNGGWEGSVTYLPTGAATQPKLTAGLWPIYCNVGDFVQADLWYSNESLISAVDTTAGLECSLRLVHVGI